LETETLEASGLYAPRFGRRVRSFDDLMMMMMMSPRPAPRTAHHRRVLSEDSRRCFQKTPTTTPFECKEKERKKSVRRRARKIDDAPEYSSSTKPLFPKATERERERERKTVEETSLSLSLFGYFHTRIYYSDDVKTKERKKERKKERSSRTAMMTSRRQSRRSRRRLYKG